jgi:MFS superfamily sulfate permease-like transporter
MTDAKSLAQRDSGFDAKRDLLASIVVFLVALPLCIGIAVAVGVSPGKALITGIIGGIVVGAFGGCPLQVCGPAAGLFVIIADAILKQRTLYAEGHTGASDADAMSYALLALGVSVMFAGVLQFVAGQLRLGQWFRAVSPAVIEGMLAGIGVLIFASQFHVMFDHEARWGDHKAHGGMQLLATIPDAVMSCFVEKPAQAPAAEKDHATSATKDKPAAVAAPRPAAQHRHAALIGILSVAIIVGWQAFAPKWLKLFPGALVAVLVGIGVVYFSGWHVEMLTVSNRILDDVTFPTMESLRMIITPSIMLTGAMIAVVASAETLLCATAVDQMQNGPRTKYDKELCAHGIGNFLCGVLGVLPMTGVIVRSSANVQAGGTSRLSTILHGVWLLIFVALLPHLLAYIPKAALGAILVYTGFKLVKYKTLAELWKIDRGEALIFLATMTIIVVEDLLLGVLAGLALSALKLLHRFSHLQPKLTIDAGGTRAMLELEGAATFIRLPVLASFLDQVPAGAELHVDFTHLTYIDHACLELITSWSKRHSSTGGRLVIDWDSLHARFKDESRSTVKKPGTHVLV